jgi:hypothetical protein
MGTFALLVIRLRRPRPRFRRLNRQPGFVACVAAGLTLLLCGATSLPLLAHGKDWVSFISYAPEVCFAVVGAWLALALAGRWHTEPGWIDRMGLAVGVLWIASNLLTWLRLALL